MTFREELQVGKFLVTLVMVLFSGYVMAEELSVSPFVTQENIGEDFKYIGFSRSNWEACGSHGKIFNDGKYIVRHYALPHGRECIETGSIEISKLNELMGLIKNPDFYSLKDHYEDPECRGRGCDHHRLSIKTDTGFKEIYFYCNYGGKNTESIPNILKIAIERIYKLIEGSSEINKRYEGYGKYISRQECFH